MRRDERLLYESELVRKRQKREQSIRGALLVLSILMMSLSLAMVTMTLVIEANQ